jgi:hypothetical protein
MKSLTFRFFKQMLPSSAVAVALLGLAAITGPARADSLCPSAASGNGSGTYSITGVAGPLDSTCGANSAEQLTIGNATDYARLAWDSTDAGYPAGLTLGNFGGASAQVGLDGALDQPFYMLAFTDSTHGLGQTFAADQILMIEFQPSTASGNSMNLNTNTTLFNLFDNTQGFYLNGVHGQQDTNTLAGWLGIDPFLGSEALQQVRIGIGLAGGSGPGQSLTVDSLNISGGPAAVPEPTSILLLLTVVLGTGLGIHRKQARNRRS